MYTIYLYTQDNNKILGLSKFILRWVVTIIPLTFLFMFLSQLKTNFHTSILYSGNAILMYTLIALAVIVYIVSNKKYDYYAQKERKLYARVQDCLNLPKIDTTKRSSWKQVHKHVRTTWNGEQLQALIITGSPQNTLHYIDLFDLIEFTQEISPDDKGILVVDRTQLSNGVISAKRHTNNSDKALNQDLAFGIIYVSDIESHSITPENEKIDIRFDNIKTPTRIILTNCRIDPGDTGAIVGLQTGIQEVVRDRHHWHIVIGDDEVICDRDVLTEREYQKMISEQ